MTGFLKNKLLIFLALVLIGGQISLISYYDSTRNSDALTGGPVTIDGDEYFFVKNDETPPKTSAEALLGEKTYKSFQVTNSKEGVDSYVSVGTHVRNGANGKTSDIYLQHVKVSDDVSVNDPSTLGIIDTHTIGDAIDDEIYITSFTDENNSDIIYLMFASKASNLTIDNKKIIPASDTNKIILVKVDASGLAKGEKLENTISYVNDYNYEVSYSKASYVFLGAPREMANGNTRLYLTSNLDYRANSVNPFVSTEFNKMLNDHNGPVMKYTAETKGLAKVPYYIELSSDFKVVADDLIIGGDPTEVTNTIPLNDGGYVGFLRNANIAFEEGKVKNAMINRYSDLSASNYDQLKENEYTARQTYVMFKADKNNNIVWINRVASDKRTFVPSLPIQNSEIYVDGGKQYLEFTMADGVSEKFIEEGLGNEYFSFGDRYINSTAALNFLTIDLSNGEVHKDKSWALSGYDLGFVDVEHYDGDVRYVSYDYNAYGDRYYIVAGHGPTRMREYSNLYYSLFPESILPNGKVVPSINPSNNANYTTEITTEFEGDTTLDFDGSEYMHHLGINSDGKYYATFTSSYGRIPDVFGSAWYSGTTGLVVAPSIDITAPVFDDKINTNLEMFENTPYNVNDILEKIVRDEDGNLLISDESDFVYSLVEIKNDDVQEIDKQSDLEYKVPTDGYVETNYYVMATDENGAVSYSKVIKIKVDERYVPTSNGSENINQEAVDVAVVEKQYDSVEKVIEEKMATGELDVSTTPENKLDYAGQDFKDNVKIVSVKQNGKNATVDFTTANDTPYVVEYTVKAKNGDTVDIDAGDTVTHFVNLKVISANTNALIEADDIKVNVGEGAQTDKEIMEALRTKGVDPVKGDITEEVVVTSKGGYDRNKVGVYTVTLSVKGSNGVVITDTAIIEVYDANVTPGKAMEADIYGTTPITVNVDDNVSLEALVKMISPVYTEVQGTNVFPPIPLSTTHIVGNTGYDGNVE